MNHSNFLLLAIAVHLTCQINIPLPRSRETCLVISQGEY